MTYRQVSSGPKRGVDLPKDCAFVSIDGTSAAVVLCRPAEDGFAEKLLKDSPSLILSLLAIVVSIYTLRATRNQQRRGIVQSIKDDYWLRTLVSPACITPLIDMRHDVLKSFPSASVTKQDLQDYSVRIAMKFMEMQDALGNLHIVDGALVGAARAKLTAVEDLVSEYIALLGQHLNDPLKFAAPDMNGYRTQVSGKFFDVLQPIQEHQIKQGDT